MFDARLIPANAVEVIIISVVNGISLILVRHHCVVAWRFSWIIVRTNVICFECIIRNSDGILKMGSSGFQLVKGSRMKRENFKKMNSLASIVYETSALVGVVVFIVGTLKTLLEDNAPVNACNRKDSITRKKRFLLDSRESPAVQKNLDSHTDSFIKHKTSDEHYTIEKMYSKNMSLLQSEKAQERKESKKIVNSLDKDSNSFLSDVLNELEHSSTMLDIDLNIENQSKQSENSLGRYDSAKDMEELDTDLLKLIKGDMANLSRKNLKSLCFNLLKEFGDICWLDLSYNQLQCLPEEFGSLEKLVHLNLKQNMLEHLPISFKNLSQLKVLDLSYNNIQELGIGYIV